MTTERALIVVVAAVIERDGRFFVQRRVAGSHLSGYWEFPGGKCEPGESHEACLSRELAEELDVDAEVGEEIIASEHAYPERTVRLHFRRCRLIGEPRPVLGQEVRWVTPSEMTNLPFPEADKALVEILTNAP